MDRVDSARYRGSDLLRGHVRHRLQERFVWQGGYKIGQCCQLGFRAHELHEI